MKGLLVSITAVLNLISGGILLFLYLTFYYEDNKMTSLEQQLSQLKQDNQKILAENRFLKQEMRLIQEKEDSIAITANEKGLPYAEVAARRIIAREGIYDNDPDDRGKETCYGISRKHNPDHPIWAPVDVIKQKLEKNKIPLTQKNISQAIKQDDKILKIACMKYIKQWNDYGLDNYPFVFSMAWFDIIVNCGDGMATRSLQTVLNGFNHNGRFGDDLVVDGGFGKKSKVLLAKAIELGYHDKLVAGLQGMKANHYVTLAMNNKSQRKYINGWFNR